MPKVQRGAAFRRATAATSGSHGTSSSASPVFVAAMKRQNDDGAPGKKALAEESSTANAGGLATTNDKQTADLDQRKEEHLSRGQRKRLAKREQYLRREKLVMSSLKLKRAEEQKKRIDGLDAIREALMATVSSKPGAGSAEGSEQEKKPVNLLRSDKSKKLLVQREASQMNLVLQHPSFQADPLATIQEHLQNTLAKDAEKQKREDAERRGQQRLRDEKKKAHKREQGIKKSKRKRCRATRSKAQ